MSRPTLAGHLTICQNKKGKQIGSWIFSSYLKYKGQPQRVCLRMGYHPNPTKKLATLKSRMFPLATDPYTRWYHKQKINMLLEFFRMKEVIKQIQEAKDGKSN
jgi:hypothetical protein